MLLQQDQLGLLLPGQVLSRDTLVRAVGILLTSSMTLDAIAHLFNFQEVRFVLAEVDHGSVLDDWLLHIIAHPHQLRLDTGCVPSIRYPVPN